jgi:uncharacterized peroxidase-related enzyme
MTLIEPLEPDDDPQFQAMIEHYRQTSGFVPNGLLAMRRRPEIQQAVQSLHKAAMASHPGSRVTPELKVLLAHLASRASGCRYCQAHTAQGAERRGEDPQRLDQIWEFRTSELFNDAERAALELAVGAGVTPNGVTPEMRADARLYWTDDELVEIVAIISVMGFMNRWHDTIATPLEDEPKDYANRRLAQQGWEVGKH